MRRKEEMRGKKEMKGVERKQITKGGEENKLKGEQDKKDERRTLEDSRDNGN